MILEIILTIITSIIIWIIIFTIYLKWQEKRIITGLKKGIDSGKLAEVIERMEAIPNAA